MPISPLNNPNALSLRANHYRTPFIPAAVRVTLNFALLQHNLFDAFIQTANAKRPFTQRAQQLVLIESLNNRPGSAPSRTSAR